MREKVEGTSMLGAAKAFFWCFSTAPGGPETRDILRDKVALL